MKSSIVNGENRGSVNNLLLKALSTGDKYGYEINKEIETKSRGKYFLKEASLYSGLKRLEANGFITSYWKDGELGIRRHYYSITESGLEKLKNSNFSFDSSKEFIGEMFKNEKLLNTQNIELKTIDTLNLEEKVANTASPLNSNINEINNNLTIINNENINTTNNKQEKVEKKNPFQIEVSPFQQSIFDLNLNNSLINADNIEEKQVLNNENDNNSIVSNLTTKEPAENEILSTPLVENLNEKTMNQDTILEQNDNKEKFVTKQVTYDELINEYSQKNYTESIKNEKNNIDVSKFFNKENTNSIILTNNEKLNINLNENNYTNELINEKNNQNSFNSSLENDTLSLNNYNDNDFSKTEKDKDINEETNNTLSINIKNDEKQENKVDIKNIFGNLLVENENNLESIEQKIENNEQVDKQIEKTVKKELPRIDIDDNINVMLNSNALKQKPDFPNSSIDNNIKSGTNNIPSVKQYINNVHKKTLISRATSVNEEVNLEGINIREYKKMNNKPIKNTNFIYINKLNLVLTLAIFGLIFIESIISFAVFNNIKILTWVEIVLLSSSIISAIIWSVFIILKYIKDKFKVEIKNYNFKTNLFYSILILIVSIVILICINLFEGVNPLLSNGLGIKILLESLLALNIVLYPTLKYVLYKLKYFSS